MAGKKSGEFGFKPSRDVDEPQNAVNPKEEVILKLINNVRGKEVVLQFAAHQPFLLSGLDDKEEFKSRMAFVDMYRDEFAEIHAWIRNTYGSDELNDFSYLKDSAFRNIAGKQDENGNRYFLADMMKDYMSYRHLRGEIGAIEYNSYLSKEKAKEKEFRRQFLSKKDRDFLLDESIFSIEKKHAIRECRKWMYRNCAKSGYFNETGSKRNYVDSFAKKPVYIQAGALCQIEKGLYKYADEPGVMEKHAVSPEYVPKFSIIKDKLTRSKANPYNLYKKATGDFFYWSRLERALKKSEERQSLLKKHYGELELEKRLNKGVGGQKNEEEEKPKKRYVEIKKPTENLKEIKQVNTALKAFGKERDKYLDCLDKYMKDRSHKNYKKLQDQGVKIQRLVKCSKYSRIYENIDSMKDEKPFGSFLEFTCHLRYARKMDDKTIEKIKKEKAVFASELTLTIKGLADKGYSLSSGIAGVMSAGEKLEKVSRGFSIGTAVSSAYTCVKDGIMSLVSWTRKKKAEDVQVKNRKNQGGSAQAMDLDSRRINDMAKVSKKRNANKAKGYLAEGGFAAAAVGFTTLGLVGIVALPLTIAGGVVAGAGFGIKYALDYYTRKRTSQKSLDSTVKTEEYEKSLAEKKEKKKKPSGRAAKEEHKKFIDKKVEERRRILEDKKQRFGDGESGRKVLDDYVEDRTSDKIKDRIRTNIAVEKGNLTIYSFCDSQDHENVMEAYRHMFLKHPDGPVDAENLLTPEQVKLYMSQKPEDLVFTGQTDKQAMKRALYKQVMQSEGVRTKAPANLEEAKEMIKPKMKQKVVKAEKQMIMK